ncbi:MAG: hypothetical protein LJE95_12920 [Acidobacteria bacterium]|jgi:hypothetical protein|nr:hypothetical protein [Acidobacteriota bacterium]
MQAFEVPGMGPVAFVDRVRKELSGRELGEIVTLELDGDELVVRFSRMGTSELRYALDVADGGFSARLTDERIALLHGAFRQTFEEKFDQIIAHVGARSQQSGESVR